MTPGSVARFESVSRTYTMGDQTLHALDAVDVTFGRGEYTAIMGPSGCGKSTMLNLLGCLDRPSAGRYWLGGEDVSTLDDDTLSAVRGSYLGFIFQSYNLIQQLSVIENIEVPFFYQGVPPAESRERAAALAGLVGLGHRLHHRPHELSGGQQQRVGIARALANDPLLILADEPTGNLDSRSGSDILQLFDKLHAEDRTIVVVTHDPEVGRRAQRIVRLRDGRIESDERHG